MLIKTNCLTKIMMFLSLELCLFRISTTAWLLNKQTTDSVYATYSPKCKLQAQLGIIPTVLYDIDS